MANWGPKGETFQSPSYPITTLPCKPLRRVPPLPELDLPSSLLPSSPRIMTCSSAPAPVISKPVRTWFSLDSLLIPVVSHVRHYCPDQDGISCVLLKVTGECWIILLFSDILEQDPCFPKFLCCWVMEDKPQWSRHVLWWATWADFSSSLLYFVRTPPLPLVPVEARKSVGCNGFLDRWIQFFF